jgi:hypothetical protein
LKNKVLFMTPFKLWGRAQIAAAALALPILLSPALLYILVVAINLVFGLPAIVFFYLLLKLMQLAFANSKPVSRWAAAMACLPGMLLITGGCILIATVLMCDLFHERFEWAITLFGLPAMIGTVISVCISCKDIHRFIYPDLYAQPVKENAMPPAGMVYPQHSTTGHTEDH